MRLTLKQPVQMNSQELSWIEFRRANAGDMLFARGDIARDKRMDASMVNDPMTIAAYVARRTAVASNVTGNLPIGWVFALSMSDLTDLADVINALDGGFASLEEFRADAAERRANAERQRDAEERGEAFPAQPAADHADGSHAVPAPSGADGHAG